MIRKIKRRKASCVCVMLILCLAGSMFMTSCQSGDSIVDIVANRRPVTLTLLTIVGDSTTPEGIAEVEKELNLITESRFTTRIKLVGLTQSEYEAEIARRFEVYDEEEEKLKEEASIEASLRRASQDRARQERAAGITQPATRKPTEPPRTTELYTQRIQWPDITENQIDIFLITSSDMFAELLEDSRLESVDDELTTKAKVLREYIHPSVMMAGTYNERTFAIPTNKAIGTATYIAVNKRLAEEYNLYAEAYNLSLAADEAEDRLSVVNLDRLSEYNHLTDYLAWVKANRPGAALIEGPFVPLKNYESLFPDMPYFPSVSSLGAVGTARPLVYTPEQEPTEAPTRAPTEPPTDADGQLIVEETASTTIPATTLPPRNTPAVTNLEPASIAMQNKYTHASFTAIAKLNQEFRELGLFETSQIPDDRERAAYLITGTLEDMMNRQIIDAANGFDYEYILYAHPIASKEELQKSMYAVSVSSKVPVMRCMEIITLLNTNSKFKNIFQYGVPGTHHFYNDDGRIEYINDDYMMNMDHTGNHFIADLAVGDHPNKWQLAKVHNLNVVSSVFLNFYFDKTKLTADAEEAIPELNSLGERFYNILINGNIPSEYEDIDDYIAGFVTPEFEAAGWTDFHAEVRTQTNPPTD